MTDRGREERATAALVSLPPELASRLVGSYALGYTGDSGFVAVDDATLRVIFHARGARADSVIVFQRERSRRATRVD